MVQPIGKTESIAIIRLALLVMVSLLPNIGNAHDYWANGKKVPDWVKASCCGPADVHRLTRCQVKMDSYGSFTKMM
jgi:hypothetical protein